MFTIKRSGSSAADLARLTRDIPARVIPYAASSALTRTARAAVPVVQTEMRRVFHQPVAYTLNALRVVPSTIETMTARIAVKDAVSRGTRPESYLLPEVEGGPRSPKGIELALRFAGYLRAGEFVVPGGAAPLDAAGNLPSSTVRTILRQLEAGRRTSTTTRRRATTASYFVGAVRGTRGVWKRDAAGGVHPILIFTSRPPVYRSRLDFEGVVERLAREQFPQHFAEAAAAILDRD